jgi:hypothetical protein
MSARCGLFAAKSFSSPGTRTPQGSNATSIASSATLFVHALILSGMKFGAPGTIRTSDPQIRRLSGLVCRKVLTGQVRARNTRLRACEQCFRSIRFVRYRTLELAAASESLLFGPFDNIDQHIPRNWAAGRWSRNKSTEISSAPTRAAHCS